MLVARQRFGYGDDTNTEPHQQDLRQARPWIRSAMQARDQPGYSDI